MEKIESDWDSSAGADCNLGCCYILCLGCWQSRQWGEAALIKSLDVGWERWLFNPGRRALDGSGNFCRRVWGSHPRGTPSWSGQAGPQTGMLAVLGGNRGAVLSAGGSHLTMFSSPKSQSRINPPPCYPFT